MSEATPRLLAPAEEIQGVSQVGPPGVRVADVGGEILDEPGDGILAGRGEDFRNGYRHSGRIEGIASNRDQLVTAC